MSRFAVGGRNLSFISCDPNCAITGPTHRGVEGQRHRHVGPLHLLVPDVAPQRRPVLATHRGPVRHNDAGRVHDLHALDDVFSLVSFSPVAHRVPDLLRDLRGEELPHLVAGTRRPPPTAPAASGLPGSVGAHVTGSTRVRPVVGRRSTHGARHTGLDTGWRSSWLKAIGGALAAAVVSAFLLSTLGAAFSSSGRRSGSLVTTVGSALFTQGLATSKGDAGQGAGQCRQKVGIAGRRCAARVVWTPRPGRATWSTPRAARRGQPGARRGRGRNRRRRPDPAGRSSSPPCRGNTSPGSAGLFVAAIVAITAFGLVAGRSVSSITRRLRRRRHHDRARCAVAQVTAGPQREPARRRARGSSSPATGPATSRPGTAQGRRTCRPRPPPHRTSRAPREPHAEPLRHSPVTLQDHRAPPGQPVGSVQCRVRLHPFPRPRGGVPGPGPRGPVAPATAAGQVGTRDIAKDAIVSSKIKDGSLQPADLPAVARTLRCARTPASS